MRKKRVLRSAVVLTLILALVTAVFTTGCSTILSGKKKEIILASGGTAGTYFSVGGAMANILNSRLTKSSLTVLSTGGSGENLRMLSEERAGLAIVQNDVMYYAYTGTDIYEEEGKHTNFSAVAGLYDESLQIVTCRDDLSSVNDLKGLVVSVGDSGSGVEFNARQVLDSYGMSFSDIQVVNASFADSAEGLADGSIDAAFIVSGVPTKAVTDLASQKSIKLIGIDDEHIRILKEKYGFYTESTIPSDTYSGLDSDIKTVSVRATLVASNRLDRELIEELLSEMFDEQKLLAEGENRFSDLTPENAVKGINIPFHEGAVRYYKELELEGF